jgi:MSHA pilin protein MshD
MAANPYRTYPYQSGFSLIETVIGIAVFAVAMTFILTAFLPMVSKQAEPVYQLRAAELGQAMLQDALSRSFDENADRTGRTESGKYLYCGDISTSNTDREQSSGSCSSTLGPDNQESYAQFNDVDDFNAYCQQAISGATLAQWQGLDTSLYDNYSIQVCVVQAPELVGLSGRQDVAKQITVTVTTPSGEHIPFTAYRSNY